MRNGYSAHSMNARAALSRSPMGAESVRCHRDYFSSLSNWSSVPISDVVDLLRHVGCLTARSGGGYRFASSLLEDW